MSGEMIAIVATDADLPPYGQRAFADCARLRTRPLSRAAAGQATNVRPHRNFIPW
jgi:hypothetical protein